MQLKQWNINMYVIIILYMYVINLIICMKFFKRQIHLRPCQWQIIKENRDLK